MKVVLVWDSTSTCSATGTNPDTGGSICTAWSSDTLDADMDLQVYDANNNLVAQSDSYDNNYETVDVPVTQGESLYFRIHLYQANATWTYLSLAFYRY